MPDRPHAYRCYTEQISLLVFFFNKPTIFYCSDCWGDREHCCPDGLWSCGKQSYSCVIAAFADPSASAVDTRDYDCNRAVHGEWAWAEFTTALHLATVLVGFLVYFVGALVAMCYCGPQQNGFIHPLHELGCHALAEVCCLSYWYDATTFMRL